VYGAFALVAVGALGWAVLAQPGPAPTGEPIELAPARPRAEAQSAAPVALALSVVARHPHDRGAFTQGLVWHEGKLFESTGLEGRSSLREVELDTGSVLRKVDLRADLFGEGLALVGERLVQITWRDGVAYEWSAGTFERLAERAYAGEGWGLCYDGQDLVMSDGSARLTFRDPASFEARRTVLVTKGGEPLPMLNELECVRGAVYANIWQTDEIVRIDPRSGRVTGTVDASGLLTAAERPGTDVLNGIAFVPETGRFLITGKLWPTIFEVELTEP
jgi:glutamine cyclotransferase